MLNKVSCHEDTGKWRYSSTYF